MGPSLELMGLGSSTKYQFLVLVTGLLYVYFFWKETSMNKRYNVNSIGLWWVFNFMYDLPFSCIRPLVEQIHSGLIWCVLGTHLHLLKHFDIGKLNRPYFYYSSLGSPFQKLQNHIFFKVKKHWPLSKRRSTTFSHTIFFSFLLIFFSSILEVKLWLLHFVYRYKASCLAT